MRSVVRRETRRPRRVICGNPEGVIVDGRTRALRRKKRFGLEVDRGAPTEEVTASSPTEKERKGTCS